MKITTQFTFCDVPTIASLEKTFISTLTADTKSVLILASEADEWVPEEIDPLLKGISVPVAGGVFPQILYEGKQYTTGTLVIGLNVALNVFVIENLSQGQNSIEEQLACITKDLENEKYLLTLIDGLAENIQRFIDNLYEITGHNSTFFGGGAGTVDFIQKPCLFTNKGMIADAAIIGGVPVPYTLGVSHGWEIADGPFLVTKSKGKELEKLDYLPALSVYKTHVSKDTECHFDEDAFFSIAKNYPLGIENIEGEILVRAPIAEADNSIIFTAEVPENSIIYLLKGSVEGLINASGQSTKAAYEANAFTHREDISVMLFDCMSRPLFLGDDFHKELDIIKENLNSHQQVFGVLSLGEIGSSKNGPIEWLNNSTAIAVF